MTNLTAANLGQCPAFPRKPTRLTVGIAMFTAVGIVVVSAQPTDPLEIVVALSLMIGPPALLVIVQRKDFVVVVVEAAMTILGGALFYLFEFPVRFRTSNYTADLSLFNLQSGVVFGWLLSSLIVHIYAAGLNRISRRDLQFSLARCLASVALLCLAMHIWLRYGAATELEYIWRFTAVSVVCSAAAAGAIGLLCNHGSQLVLVSVIIVLALLSPYMIASLATVW